MRQNLQVLISDELRAQRVEYFRTVVEYAALVNRGADLEVLVEASRYVALFEVAKLVPALSTSATVLSVAELRVFVRRLAGDPGSVRRVLAQAIARHCLSQDVIRRIAEHHDEAIAIFWQLKTGTHVDRSGR